MQALIARCEDWCSVRLPMVWRTRAWFWVPAGLLAAALAAPAGSLAGTLLQPDGSPSVAVSVWIGLWSFIEYGLLLLLLVDISRRATRVTATTHRLRLFVSVLASVLACLLPQWSFVAALGGPSSFNAVDAATKALAASGAITLVACTRLWWANVASRAFALAQWSWRWPWFERFDTWLAACAPSLWSSRVTSWLWLVPALLVVGFTGAEAFWFAVPGLVAACYAMFRAQESACYLPTTRRRDIKSFLVHLMAFLLSSDVGARLVAVHDGQAFDYTSEGVLVSIWAGAIFASALQAARVASALAAWAGLILALIFGAVCGVLADEFGSFGPMLALFMILPVFLLAALLRMLVGVRMLPGVQRTSIATLLVAGQFPAIALGGGPEEWIGAVLRGGVAVSWGITLLFVTDSLRRWVALLRT